MVAFYEAYSSVQFVEYQDKLKLNEFVQSKTAQIENVEIMPIIKPKAGQIVQFETAQFPKRSFGRIYTVFEIKKID